MAQQRRPSRPGGVAAAVRRRQNDRGPRVLLQDRDGHPRALAPSQSGYDELLSIAEQMVEVVEPAKERRRSRSSGGRQ